jgi:hypothetical protein
MFLPALANFSNAAISSEEEEYPFVNAAIITETISLNIGILGTETYKEHFFFIFF